MAKILHIIGNPHKDGSASRAVAQSFIDAYSEANPSDTVEVLDLADTIVPHVDQTDVDAIYAQTPTEEQQKRLDYIHALIDQFLSADKIIITSPMWNFGIPSVLKAYIDHLVVKDKTFTFTDKGPVGLIEGKKLMIISAMGGDYSQEPLASMEMQTSYLQTIFGWLGIEDQMYLDVAGTAMGDTAEVIAKYQEEAKALASKF